MNKKVSVIITAYNAESTISKSLESIFSQTYPAENIELIVVNDGSTDNTNKILAELQKKHNFILINQENLGSANALNAGLKTARGEFIFVLSHDCYACSDWIEKTVKIFSTDDQIGIVQGKILPTREINYPIYHCFELKTENVWYQTAAIAYSMEAVELAGKFFLPELSRCGHDTDLAWRIIKKGYKTKWMDEITAYHEVVRETFLQGLKVTHYMKNLPLLLKRHPELKKQVLIAGFLFGDIHRHLNIFAFLASIVLCISGNFFLSGLSFFLCWFYKLLRTTKATQKVKCNFIEYFFILPIYSLLREVLVFLFLCYGSIKHKCLTI